jgi:hypothetical protein
MSLENLSIDARDELAALAQQLAENPSTRKEFLRMTKKVKPDLPIPELEIEESTNKALSLAEQRVQSLENKLREKDALDDLQRRRNAIKAKGLVSTEDDIKEVEKIMLDRGITNHETAAEYHQWMKQSATPTPSGYNPQIIQKMDLNKYWKNPVTAARNEAVNALQELRRPNRPIGL